MTDRVVSSLRTRPLDTSEQAWEEQIRILRSMPPERRMAIGFELTRMISIPSSASRRWYVRMPNPVDRATVDVSADATWS